MAEVVDKYQAYATKLDEYLDQNLTSSVLDTANSNIIRFDGVGRVLVPKINTSALKNYDREKGFPKGKMTISTETLELAYDRGIEFNVDNVSDEETAFARSVSGMNQFMQEFVVPEVDAVRFMRYANGAATKVNGKLTKNSIADAIQAARKQLFEDRAGSGQLFLFVSADVLGLIENDIKRVVNNGEGNIVTTVETFNGAKVIPVPEQLFTANMTVEEEGFKPGSNKINFLLVNPRSVRQLKKHEKIRRFQPDVNQDMDAWKFQYRLYHDAWVLPNMQKGVYVHTTAAITASVASA